MCFDCGPTSLVLVGAVGAEEAILLLVASLLYDLTLSLYVMELIY